MIQIIGSLRLSMSLKCFLILVKMFEKDLDIRCKPLLDKGITKDKYNIFNILV